MTPSLGLIPAALTWTKTSPAPGTGRGTSRTSRTSMPPYESNCTALDMKRTPILSFGPRLEVVEGNVGKFTAKRRAIHRKTDAVHAVRSVDLPRIGIRHAGLRRRRAGHDLLPSAVP